MKRGASTRLRGLVALLWMAVLASALAAVYARHEARKLFVELQALERARDELDIDWGRLRIEQGMLATHARVERLASEKLGMRLPAAAEVSVAQDREARVASSE